VERKKVEGEEDIMWMKVQTHLEGKNEEEEGGGSYMDVGSDTCGG
jgi:hypothetical protein